MPDQPLDGVVVALARTTLALQRLPGVVLDGDEPSPIRLLLAGRGQRQDGGLGDGAVGGVAHFNGLHRRGLPAPADLVMVASARLRLGRIQELLGRAGGDPAQELENPDPGNVQDRFGEGVGMKCPADVYEPSRRRYAGLPELS